MGQVATGFFLVFSLFTSASFALDNDFFASLYPSTESDHGVVRTSTRAVNEGPRNPLPLRFSFQHSGNTANLCGGGAVGKKKLDNGGCEFAIQTAGHCIHRRNFQSVTIQNLNVTLPASAMRYDIPPSVAAHVEGQPPPQNDVGILYLTASCELIRDDQVFEFAPISPASLVELPRDGQVMSFNRFTGPFIGALNGTRYSSGQQGADVVRGRTDPGDSGSPILNKQMQILGSLSGGVGAVQFTFPLESLAWVKERVAKWSGAPETPVGTQPSGPTGNPNRGLAGNLGGNGGPVTGGGTTSPPLPDPLNPPPPQQFQPPGPIVAGAFRFIRPDAKGEIEAVDARGNWGRVLATSAPLKTKEGTVLSQEAAQEFLQAYQNTPNPRQFYGERYEVVAKVLKDHGMDFNPNVGQVGGAFFGAGSAGQLGAGGLQAGGGALDPGRI